MCREYGTDEPVPHFVLEALQRAMGPGWAEDFLSRNHFLEPHVRPLRAAIGMTPESVGPLTCGELRWHASALASVLKVIGTDPLPARSVPSKRAVTLPIWPTRGRHGGPHPR